MDDTPIIIGGAGPAGLTAAIELLARGQGPVLVLESDSQVGGLSKTVHYKGNHIDIGGHRFFSKSDWVMNWWQQRLPIAHGAGDVAISYRNQTRTVGVAGSGASAGGDCLLVRNRLSRIFSQGKFFDYPLKANWHTARQLGLAQCMLFGGSYAWSHLFPRRPEISLEDFFVNRFGYGLYRQFFKDYSEKVWGVDCRDMSADWGAQRVKSLSLVGALVHALQDLLRWGRKLQHTSLLERFLYPTYGPGQMWEKAASELRGRGGGILLQHSVVGLEMADGRVSAVLVRDLSTRQERTLPCRHFVSSLPVSELVPSIRGPVPAEVARIARCLSYRDFLTVGLLARKMSARDRRSRQQHCVPDNWIYIQENNVKLGRLQVFNNWSPAMVADPSTVWLGLEYFCQENDALWSMSDPELVEFGARELEKIRLVRRSDVMDGMVLRVPKAYPGYYGAYADFPKVRDFVDGVENLWLIGRNGMHRYNNQDHSMLTARLAAEGIAERNPNKAPLWDVNVDDDYHEEGEMSLDVPTDLAKGHPHPRETLTR